MTRPKVLIADDEASILTSTAALLHDLGFDVATCGAAPDIAAAVERERPDLLLQDVRMPGLDLEGLVLGLRGTPRGRRLPIVLFTASMDVEEIGLRVGAAGLVEKPFRPRDILLVLTHALAAPAAGV